MSGVQYVVTSEMRAFPRAPILAVLARRMTVEHSARKTKARGPAEEAYSATQIHLAISTYIKRRRENHSRYSDHGRTICRIGRQLQYSTDDKEARYHSKTAPDKQRATADTLSGVEADSYENNEHSVDCDRSEEGLLKTGLLEKVRGIGKDDRRSGPKLILEWDNGNDGSSKIGTPETVQNRDVLALRREDFTIFNLFQDDGVFVLDVVVRYRPVDPTEVAPAFLVLAPDGVESRCLRDNGEHDGSETDKEPHRVDGIAPFVDGLH